jgi:peptidoglycan/xylan/chitin deacetylase (PgdA/CDA1 family)/GT2 family glycosyltransferase/SAM-dependent methyltransferase
MTPIAVVIPCYNLGRTLEEALDSLLEQTRPADEVVVVDDGSTDLYTRQVLAAVDRPRTRVLRTPNRGLPAARNHGVRLTTSSYVVTLDADDKLTSSYLEKTAGFLDNNPDIGFVSTGIQAFGEVRYNWTPPSCSILNALTRGSAHPASMFRRELWNSVGGFDEVSPIHGVEDVDFWLSALIAGYQGAVIAEPLLLYRVRRDSMHQVNVASGRHLKAMEALFRKHRPAIDQAGIELLIEQERFRLEQERHIRELEQRQAAAEEKIRILNTAIEAERNALADQPRVNWGDLGKRSPISPVWGTDRGIPIDRRYIHEFLEQHRPDVRGRVLEVKDSSYTNLFADGGDVDAHVIDVDAGKPHATLVADLTKAEDVPGNEFDCFILTQTLHMIYDIRTALTQAVRLLKPGGVLFCTIPAVSRVDFEKGGPDTGDYWRLTQGAVRQLFSEVLPLDAFTVTSYGNVRTCIAFLYGLAVEDLQDDDFKFNDPWFPLIHCVRAIKPRGPRQIGGIGATHSSSGAILLYHRVTTKSHDPFRLCIPPTRFRDQMQFLKEHCNLISLTDFIDAMKSASLPPRAVAITFDDGYLDNLTTASPILTDIGVPATFFVTTDRFDERHEFWWDTLARLFLQEPSLPESIELPEGLPRVNITADTDRRQALMTVHRAIRCMPVDQRNNVIEQLVRQAQNSTSCDPGDRPLLADEVHALAERAGHEIGAHTRHHLSLPNFPVDVQTDELTSGTEPLEALLGRRVRAVAYPFGDATAQTAALARAVGFTIGLIVGNRPVSEIWDPMMVPRIEVQETDSSASLESWFTGSQKTVTP